MLTRLLDRTLRLTQSGNRYTSILVRENTQTGTTLENVALNELK